MKRAALFVTVAACTFGLTVTARSRAAEDQVSHAPRAIAMEVLLVRTNWGPHDERSLRLSGPTGGGCRALRELESRGPDCCHRSHFVDHASRTKRRESS